MPFYGLILAGLFFSCSTPDLSHEVALTSYASMLTKVPKLQYFSDTLKQIIDELELCENYFWPPAESCYQKNWHYQFYSIVEGQRSYKTFLMVEAGGSGGNGIFIYTRQNEKLEMIQEEFAFFDTLSGETTNGFHDLILIHRDFSRGYIRTLYRWDGKRYVPDKILDINSIPAELLTTMKILKPEVNFEDRDEESFVEEYEGVSTSVYFELRVDTIINVIDEKLILAVKIEDHYSKNLEKCWVVKQVGEKYELLDVSGTSVHTYVQDELGELDYKTLK